MLNIYPRNSKINKVNSLIIGFLNFLDKNTGDTENPRIDHYVLNNQGILSNNRHFIADTRLEAQPNGDATTEGQSLLILGLLHCYRGSNRRNKKYLDLAIKYWESYVKYFYNGVDVPDKPQRWVCNWIVNGKEPVLANYPVDYNLPTHSGFKGIELEFKDGRCQVPHGSPYFGEYLDTAFFAFDGSLAWGTVVASVQAYKDDGITVDWTKDGTTYDLNWIIDWKGRKVDFDGNILEEVATELKGTIQLKDTSVQGIHKVNFSPRIPVEYGGRLIGRNEPQHNRPLHVPVLQNNLGNASDAEQWFLEASRILYDETKDERYYKAWKASEFTILECTDIDRLDKFFRKAVDASTPYTDGIAYDYNYTSDGTDPVVGYDRTEDGYIKINTDRGCKNTLEQQAINFRVNYDSRIHIEYGGGTEDHPIEWKLAMKLSSSKSIDDTIEYSAVLPSTKSDEIKTLSLTLSSLISAVNNSKVIGLDIISTWGDLVAKSLYQDNVYDTRSTSITRFNFVTTDDGFSIGNWNTKKNFKIDSIYYRSNVPIDFKFVDKDGWNWYYLLESTNGYWVKKDLIPSQAHLRWYQSNEGTSPDLPIYEDVNEVTVGLDDELVENAYIDIYCLNELPSNPDFSQDLYTMLVSITSSCDEAYTAYLGDFTIDDYVKNNLYCTPGVIPFSNIYLPDAYQFDAWHGLPYPGYQYPTIYYRCDHEDKRYMMNNMIEFMYQSQIAYNEKFGVLGPCMQAYVWNRWDNFKYGDPDTWTMEHWHDEAWSGYEPRAFYAGANCWLELVRTQQIVPDKLIQFTENWIKWLIDYFNQYNATPTYFPKDKLPYYVEGDFTGHMTGLWLAGTCSAYMAGCRVEGLQDLIEKIVDELCNYYIVATPNHIMNGSWSPSPRLSSGDDKTCNGIFFGFWAGEILRGLGLYMQYKNNVETLEDKVENDFINPEDLNTLDTSLTLYSTEDSAIDNPYESLDRLYIKKSPIKASNYYLEWEISNTRYRVNFSKDGLIQKLNLNDQLVKFKCDAPNNIMIKYLYVK